MAWSLAKKLLRILIIGEMSRDRLSSMALSKQILKNMGKSRVPLTFKKIDGDNDGLISCEEMVQFFN